MSIWKLVFKILYFSTNIKFFEIASEMKLKRIPTKLYKYRSINDFTINNLQNNTLWVSGPLNQNDPWEAWFNVSTNRLFKHIEKGKEYREYLCQELLDLGCINNKEYKRLYNSINYKNRLRTIMSRKLGRKIKDIEYEELNKVAIGLARERINEFKKTTHNRIKICSFCEGYNNPLMWSHYANSHSGICIEYDFKAVDNDNLIKRWIYPVFYYKKMPDLTKNLINGEKDGIALKCALYVSIHKSQEWKYEKEWRLVLPSKIWPEDCNVEMPIIPTKIFLGSRISEKDQEKIINLAKHFKIDVYKMNIYENGNFNNPVFVYNSCIDNSTE